MILERSDYMKYTREMDNFILTYYKGKTYIPGDDPYTTYDISNYDELRMCFNHEFNTSQTTNALAKHYRKIKNNYYYRIKFEKFIDKGSSFDLKNKESGNYLKENDFYYIYYFLFLKSKFKPLTLNKTVFGIDIVNNKPHVKEIPKDSAIMFTIIFSTYEEAKQAHNDWIDYINKYNYYPEHQNDYIN